MLPTVVTAIALAFGADNFRTGLTLALAALLLLPVPLHFLWRSLFPAYRTRALRCTAIRGELAKLDQRITAIFAGYRERQQGEHFKKAYELAGRPLRELEEALSVGMFRERREVFVTAFMRQGIAVRVTASIGSIRRAGRNTSSDSAVTRSASTTTTRYTTAIPHPHAPISAPRRRCASCWARMATGCAP
jgi:hypothetical protein